MFLRPHVDDYGRLSVLYEIVRNAFDPHRKPYADVAKKTEALVRDQVAAYGFRTTLPPVTIDQKALDALRPSQAPGRAKVINLGKGIIRAVIDGQGQQPYLVPIGERADAILEAYDDRQIGTREALQQIEALLIEYIEAQKQRDQSGFDLNTFTIYWVLKQEQAPGPDTLAPALDATFERFPNCAQNAAELRQLKAELYKALLPAVGKERMVAVADRLLRLQRRPT